MADFKKIKINNTTYNVKDEGAGRSLAVSGQDLSLKDGANNVLSTVTLPGGGSVGISKPVNNVQKLQVNIAAIIGSDGTVKWKMGDGFVSTSIAYDDTVLLTNYGGSGKPKPIRSNGKKYFTINSGDPDPIRATYGSFEFNVNTIWSLNGNSNIARDKFIFSIPKNPVSSSDTNRAIHSSHYIPHLYLDTNHTVDLTDYVESLEVLPVIYDYETQNTLWDTNCDFFYRLKFKTGTSASFPFTYTPASDQTVGKGYVIMREPVYSFTDAGYPDIIGMQENEPIVLYDGYETDSGTVRSGYGYIYVSSDKNYFSGNSRFVPMSIFN